MGSGRGLKKKFFFLLSYALVLLVLFNIKPFFAEEPWGPRHLYPSLEVAREIAVLLVVSDYVMYLYVFLFFLMLLGIRITLLSRVHVFWIVLALTVLSMPTLLATLITFLNSDVALMKTLLIVSVILGLLNPLVTAPLLLVFTGFLLCSRYFKEATREFKDYCVKTPKKMAVNYILIIIGFMGVSWLRIIFDMIVWTLLPWKHLLFIYYRGWHPLDIQAINSASSLAELGLGVPTWGYVIFRILLILYLAVLMREPFTIRTCILSKQQ